MTNLVVISVIALAAVFLLALGREVAIYTTTVREPAAPPLSMRARLDAARRKAAEQARPAAKATGIGLTGAALAALVGLAAGVAIILIALAVFG